jgi:hypothetical protein
MKYIIIGIALMVIGAVLITYGVYHNDRVNVADWSKYPNVTFTIPPGAHITEPQE